MKFIKENWVIVALAVAGIFLFTSVGTIVMNKVRTWF